jgi:hypothetical protein
MSGSLIDNRSLTYDQGRAMDCLRANHGEANEYTIWLEGLNFPRVTMLSLERRGLVVRGEHLNETDGYLWRLA